MSVADPVRAHCARLGRGRQLKHSIETDKGVTGNAVKNSWGRFSLYVAVRSANERIFAERKATYLRTMQRQSANGVR